MSGFVQSPLEITVKLSALALSAIAEAIISDEIIFFIKMKKI